MKLKACLLLLLLALAPCLFGGGKVYKGKIVDADGVEKDGTIINVVCFSLPNATAVDTHARSQVAIMNTFLKRFPEIFEKKYRKKYEADPKKYGDFDWANVQLELSSSSGIQITGTSGDSGPLMAIAGGVSPDIIYVNFRQSDTYIREGFLYPLDKPEDGYYAGLTEEERNFIYSKQVMEVVNRKGADGEKHVWTVPNGGLLGKVFLYRKDLLAKYGLPEPQNDWTWENLFDYCRALTNPKEGIYGIRLGKGPSESWYWVTFLWSAGGDAMVYDAASDKWNVCFDSDEATTALDFYLRLTAEHWVDEEGRDRYGYATKESEDAKKWELGQIGFYPAYIDERVFQTINPDLVGMVAVPLGYPDKNGVRHRGGEINARMRGIFSGCTNPVVRDAAWEYLKFCESEEAVGIFTRIMVEGGLGQYVNPDYLERFGYSDLVRLAPAGWKETFEIAIDTGKPEPYGQNCQLVYFQMTRPMNETDELARKDELPLNDREKMEKALERQAAGQVVPELEIRRKMLKAALHNGVVLTKEKMLGTLSDAELLKRRSAAGAVFVAIVIAFSLVFRKIVKVFSPEKIDGMEEVRWGFRKYRTAYLILLPALLSILIWKYIPLCIGSLMALQDYRIIGASKFVWLDNFANMLWDGDWWLAIWNSLRYCFLVVMLTFLPPVILAVLLQEIPVGKILFRTIFYLPAVITGLVVIFLWRSFYANDESGVLNAIMLRLPAISYIFLGLLFFFIMFFFSKRLFLHGNTLASLACLLVGFALFWFFSKFAWPILTSDVKDPANDVLQAWIIKFYTAVLAVGVGILLLSARAWRKGKHSISIQWGVLLILGIALLSISYMVTHDAYAPMKYFLRLFYSMVNPYSWLDDSDTAMLCCVIPMVWAGMGPGCLIYLAALKGISDDFYEASDIDGATFIDKILFVVIPMLKPLLIIQFVGVFIHSWASSAFILAMTGGAKGTEVAELHIFYKAYLYLKFGPATAMAWMLGFMLIGFTVYQLQILSKIEFKANTGKK